MDKELVTYLVFNDIQDMSGGSRKILKQVQDIKEAYAIVNMIKNVKKLHEYEHFEIFVYLKSQNDKDVFDYGRRLAYMGYKDEEFKRTVL